MPTSRADVSTEQASKYLQQLCKHWAHKFPVEFDPAHGTIELSHGRTVMDADAAALHVVVTAPDAEALLEWVLHYAAVTTRSFSEMPCRSSSNEAQNFRTPSSSRVATTSS